MWDMNLSELFLITIGAGLLSAQTTDDLDLARRLANPYTRQDAVHKIVALGSAKTPVLLAWAANCPEGLDHTEPSIGLADIFGELKTKDAIPFLIQNISLGRWVRPNIWMKTPEVVLGHLPAAAALIKIGPDASNALINTNWLSLPLEDHLAAILVVSRIGHPDAKYFLQASISQADFLRHYAEGLRVLGEPAK